MTSIGHLQAARRTNARDIRASAPERGFDRRVLLIPGIDNSGPAHWQSFWQRAIPGAERVEQSDWSQPTLGEWTAGLAEAIRRRPGVVLVAHSLGCALVAHFARVTGGRGVVGALLVAPADVDHGPGPDQRLSGFGPMPRQRLPFPSLVVASRNDPYVELGRAKAFAQNWAAGFLDLGMAGHINGDSGHGPWSDGRRLLARFDARAESDGLQ